MIETLLLAACGLVIYGVGASAVVWFVFSENGTVPSHEREKAAWFAVLWPVVLPFLILFGAGTLTWRFLEWCSKRGNRKG